MIPRTFVTGLLGALAGCLFTLALTGAPSPEADAVTYSPSVADVRKGVATLFDEAAFAVDNGSNPAATSSGRAFRNDFQLLVRRVVQQELEAAVDCVNSWHSGEPVANLYCPDEEAPPVP